MRRQINEFAEGQEMAYRLARELPGLSKPRRGQLLKYLGSFFAILESSQKSQKRIISACRELG